MMEQSEVLEECYEYLLSYAARGVPAEPGGSRDKEVRDHLERASDALGELESVCAVLLAGGTLQPASKYEAFFNILVQDAQKTRAALDLVASLPTISAQVIDNLNGLMHFRSVLTDLFLVTELLKPAPVLANEA
jgi:hypothetical protein